MSELEIAAWYGNTKRVIEILDENKSTQKELDTAAYEAMNKCSFREPYVYIVYKLLDKGANINAFPGFLLNLAISHKYFEVVENFLKRGADPQSSLWFCIKWRDMKMLTMLLDKGADPLIKCVPYGNGFDSPLWKAMLGGYRDAISLFKERGIRVNDLTQNMKTLLKRKQPGILALVMTT